MILARRGLLLMHGRFERSYVLGFRDGQATAQPVSLLKMSSGVFAIGLNYYAPGERLTESEDICPSPDCVERGYPGYLHNAQALPSRIRSTT